MGQQSVFQSAAHHRQHNPRKRANDAPHELARQPLAKLAIMRFKRN
jgi:hypothetical protein